MSKFESFMVELTTSADEFSRAMSEARQATEGLAVAFWRGKPWWSKVAHFTRHPLNAVWLIRATQKAGK